LASTGGGSGACPDCVGRGGRDPCPGGPGGPAGPSRVVT
jgi:hypothetical protein